MSAVPGGREHLGATPLGAVRRTTTLVITPRARWADGQTLAAVGRDLVRSADDVVTTSHAELAFDIDPAGLIALHGHGGGVPDELRGLPVQRGLRKNLARLRGARSEGGLRDAMFDDVVGASLASGYARLHEESIGPVGDLATHMSLTCIGFGTMHQRGETFDVLHYFATKQPSVDFVPNETLAWHDDRPPQPGSFRRRRMLQVASTADGTLAVTGYFRDTFMAPDGDEKIVHEYGLSATVSGPDLVLESIEATPGSLPLEHCPLAARSAQRLVGLSLPEVEVAVRRDIAGPSACTHLNDELRSLRLVPALLDELRSAHTRR